MNIIRLSTLTKKVGLGKTMIYQQIKAGKFPKPFNIGGSKLVGWLEEDIDEWIRKQLPPSH